ncbi:hypothetical protein B14911_07775 [Bacillus sp. NRRL B-14911]|nr:hypothetical protein B14911_07775 [Bacillus sp. NRRL B-14911]
MKKGGPNGPPFSYANWKGNPAENTA